MFVRRKWVAGFVTFAAMCAWALSGQAAVKLSSVEMVQPNLFFLRLEKPVRYGSATKLEPPRVVVYLRGVEWGQSWRERQFERGPVEKVEIGPWAGHRDVLQVVFTLRHVVEYRVEEVPSGLRVVFDVAVVGGDDVVIRPGHASTSDELDDALARFGKDDISLDVYDVDIANVLRMLGKQNGVNIVAGNDVKGKITVSLRHVTLREALDNIVKANGYTYVVDGDVIRVKKPEEFRVGDMVTKVYRLRYIDANSLKDAISEVVSENAKIRVFSSSFQGTTVSSSGGTVTPTTSGRTVRTSTSQQTRKAGRSSVLIVTDLPENIRHIDQIVDALDVPVPLIMIEAKLIELAPEDEGNLGIDWTKAVNVSLYGEQLQPSGMSLPYSARADIPNGRVNYGTLSASQFAAVLNFLRQHTDSKLVSNPRIVAMDNEESVISVGETFPVPQIQRGVGGQGDMVTFQYKDVNISLRVTPHISDEGTITMYVNPVIEEVTGEVVIDKNRAPITSKRTVQTVVKVKDGDTIVIGGLIKENKTRTVNKVWLLGDIPLIGNLFRQSKLERKQTDLLIFLTPHIVR